MFFRLFKRRKGSLHIGTADNSFSCPEAECIWGKPDRILCRLRTTPLMSGPNRGLETTAESDNGKGRLRTLAGKRSVPTSEPKSARTGARSASWDNAESTIREDLQSPPIGAAMKYPEAP